MPKYRLLLVARRSRHLQPLRDMLKDQSDLCVVGDALSLRETFNRAEELEPDLVLVSADLTQEPAFETIVKLFTALDSRWLQFIPGGTTAGAPTSNGQWGAGVFRLTMDTPKDEFLALIRAVLNRPRRPRRAVATPPVGRTPTASPQAQRLVLIGSSTGGVEALMTILSGFPPDCPPTAIVQHTGKGYGGSLARLLDRNCAAEVVQAADRMPMQMGRVILAAGCGAHMTLVGGAGTPQVQFRSSAPVSGHCPSVDVLFWSALDQARRAIGVLLTGMGCDGADGLLKLRNAGAFTLAQDEASSLVYGMPKAAWNNGAVISQLPINRLGPEILKRARESAAKAGKP